MRKALLSSRCSQAKNRQEGGGWKPWWKGSLAKLKRTHLSMILLLSLTHVAPGACPVLAQSMDDTVEFLEAYASDSQQVRVHGCIATIWIWIDDGKAKETVQLNVVNPATISQPVKSDEVKHNKVYFLPFQTLNKKKAVTTEEWDIDGSHTLPSDDDGGVILIGKTPELAKRLRRAFEHLVRLCGGKEEPF